MNRRIGNGCPSIFSLPKPTGAFWKMAQKQLPMKLTTHPSNHTTTICSPLSPLLSLKFFSPHKRKIHQRHSLKAFVGAAKRLTQNLFAVNPFILALKVSALPFALAGDFFGSLEPLLVSLRRHQLAHTPQIKNAQRKHENGATEGHKPNRQTKSQKHEWDWTSLESRVD
jgi:hypothetical protein